MTLKRWFSNESSSVLTIYYIFYAILVVFAKPENERSFGMHEPLGPADVRVEQYATSGVVYSKQKYLDPLNYDEGYFDFSCADFEGVPGAPNVTARPKIIGKQWYTICGTPYESHAEYVVVVWSFCALAVYAFTTRSLVLHAPVWQVNANQPTEG